MSFLRRFGAGCMCLPRGLAFLVRYRLWASIALPALLSLALAIVVWFSVFFAVEYVSGPGLNLLLSGNQPGEGGLLYTVLEWSFAFLGAVLALVLTLVLFRVLLAIAILPFLGPLLEKIEQVRLGHAIETGWRQDAMSTLAGVRISIRHSLIGILVLLLSLFLGPLSVPVNVLAQSYFLGHEAFDLLFEKSAPDRGRRKALARQWRPEIFGAGLVFFLVLFIPVIGALLAPVAVVTGCALLYYPQQTGLSAPIAGKT